MKSEIASLNETNINVERNQKRFRILFFSENVGC